MIRRFRAFWCRTFHQGLWRGNSVCRICYECGLWWTRQNAFPALPPHDEGPYRTAHVQPRCQHPYNHCLNDAVHEIGGVWWCEGCAHRVFSTEQGGYA